MAEQSSLLNEHLVNGFGVPKTYQAVWGLLVALHALFVGGVGVLDYVLDAATQPVAGIAFDYRITPNGQPSDKGRRIVAFDVVNPGPADIKGYRLRIKFRDRYLREKREFASGVTFERRDSELSDPQEDGADCVLMEVFLKNEGILEVDDRFGVLIAVPNHEWHPEAVQLISPTNQEIDASTQIGAPEKPTRWLSITRDVLFWLALAFVLVNVVAAIVFARLLRAWATKELGRRLAQKESEGYVKATKDETVSETAGDEAVQNILKQGMQVHSPEPTPRPNAAATPAAKRKPGRK